MRQPPKQFTGDASVVDPLNRMIDCIRDRTPIAGKGIGISETATGFQIFVTSQAIAAGGIAGALYAIVDEQPEYLVCKAFTADATGKPTALSGDDVLVAKAPEFRPSVWSGRQSWAAISFETSGSGNYFFAARNPRSSQNRDVYQGSNAATGTFIRSEFVCPPYIPIATPAGSALPSPPPSSVILAVDFGTTVMTVTHNSESRAITLVDMTPRSWSPRYTTGTPDECSIGAINAAANTFGCNRISDGTSITVKIPRVFRTPSSGTLTEGRHTYTYAGFNVRRGSSTSLVTNQTQTWEEVITPRYEVGSVLTVVPLPDGTYIDVTPGRTWAIDIDSNWYCTTTPNTQITGRFTAPTAP